MSSRKEHNAKFVLSIFVSVIIGTAIGFLVNPNFNVSEIRPLSNVLGSTNSEQITYYESAPGTPVPSVNMIVHEDPMKGWNIQLLPKHFTLGSADESNSLQVITGYALLTIDGKKTTRLYDDWFYIPRLDPGKHVITVVLYSSDHKEFRYQGRPIGDSETVLVTSE